jgi:hypothetical protein
LIHFKKYGSSHFIIGIDTEKVLGASFSGINCRQDLISINVKGANGNLPDASVPEQMYVTLQPDYVVEIRESGVFSNRLKIYYLSNNLIYLMKYIDNG